MSKSLYYQSAMDIDARVYDFVEEAHNAIKDRFDEFEDTAQYNQARILNAFQKYQIGLRHFSGTTGYGYGDDGRDVLDKVYSEVFGSEDALVRPHWVSGTHVLSDGLFALLRPGDMILSVTGRPYDTLNEVIGIGEKASGSLREWGVSYDEIPLLGSTLDYDRIKDKLRDKRIRLVFIQRSRGYSQRDSLSVYDIDSIVRLVKDVRNDVLVMVDNCYCEFTEDKEPTSVGADLVVGSLIKNPGGGLAPTGAYAAGTKHAVELVAKRLTSPGIGREVGSYQGGYTAFYQGLFLAPHTVEQALKGAVLFARLFEDLGYRVSPGSCEKRYDIVQSIEFNTAEELIAFCQAVQASSPVDGHAVPFPWDMPGYEHQVIMAAGTFVQGASIELSADAPIREPYIAYLQGGLTYSHVKIAALKVLTRLKAKGFIIL
ncbi:MAG TPA: methionine gamma-lyase family protein [Candidatus Atribacteria bacterium]|nr:methionine gamma-lyase family protein [Candidatus Atribacteria bacterium]HPT77925.1 methionine gamma-lyase family protein [Candidatus Atribacteria bacterium]